MPSPASLARVYAALCRLQPPGAYSEDDDSLSRRELSAIAWPLGRAVDYWESLLPGLLLEDEQLLDRWESLLRVGLHPGDQLAARVARLLPTLRRRLTYSRARLAAVLAPLLGVSSASLQWIEVMRSEIEAAMTDRKVFGTSGSAVTAAASPGFVAVMDKPWPSEVDDFGVALTIKVTTADPSDITIRVIHSSGVTWIAHNGGSSSLNLVTIFARSEFLGLPARGPWRVEVDTTGAHGAATVTECALLVSNDSDSAQIYTSYCLRDVGLGVTTDVAPAQRMIERAGIAHVLARVVERDGVLCDDAHSLTDREPVGS